MISKQQEISIKAIVEIIDTFKQQDKIDIKLAELLALHAQFLEHESKRLKA